MLEYLHLKNVGPAPEMEMELAPRLNLITGDNGLGKSFLLDVAWWALTRTWAGHSAVPPVPPAAPEVSYRYTATKGTLQFTSTFDRETGRWSVPHGRPAIPGLVLYAQVDGSFAVWDPARNYWKGDFPERPAAYLFSAPQVWEGNDLCEGLIRDWASWQREGSAPYKQLLSVLRALSPSPSELLEPGELRKISLDDPKRYPTLKMSYGEEVAVIHASAGMRRVIALGYLLVWTWQEHLAACQLRGDAPAKEIIFLIDEIEAHLHPQWQRRIVPALLDVMDVLTGQHGFNVQLVTATHSPLVLASAEPTFDPARDAWFDFDLEGSGRSARVALRRREFLRHGDVSNWLTSEAFDLKSSRSLEAEGAIEKARALLRGSGLATLEQARTVDQELRRAALPDIDPFWVRWGLFMESLGGDR